MSQRSVVDSTREVADPRLHQCGPMDPVFHAADGMRVKAWYCPKCGAWARAVGRERLITQKLWESNERKKL